MILPKLPTTIKAISADLLTKHPELADRLSRAIDLIHSSRLRFAYHTEEGSPVYYAVSSDGATTYAVMAGSCTCPARKLCYHRVARGILTIRSANQAEVAFGDALALEEPTPPQAPPTTQAQEVEVCAEHPVFVPAKRVQSVGRISAGLTIRHSMNRLGQHLTEIFSRDPVTAKVH